MRAISDAEPIVRGSHRQLMAHPAGRLARQAELDTLKYAEALFLTPASRAKTGLPVGEREAATWASHFGYGAACGALYGALAANRRVPHVAAGVGFGLAVWAGSYLGWLPAAGILRPATEHPPRRTALMIAAHVVWGATTGFVVNALSEEDGEEVSGVRRRGKTIS